jgi:microcystin-dependent protein
MDAFTGEIRMLPYTFAPYEWARCEGQLYPASQNQALFSILGAIFGGDGRTNFNLPDLRGRAPMHSGTGPGLSRHVLGEKSGGETAQLTEQTMPAHNHAAIVNVIPATAMVPTSNYLSIEISPEICDWATITDPGKLVPMNGLAIAPNGGSQPHENRQPFLVTQFCICLEGIYPSRS